MFKVGDIIRYKYQEKPYGVIVGVIDVLGVTVEVMVGVTLGVCVMVFVGVIVCVCVGVDVIVLVGVTVLVGVGVGPNTTTPILNEQLIVCVGVIVGVDLIARNPKYLMMKMVNMLNLMMEMRM